MNFSGEYSETNFDRLSEEEIEERIENTLQIIEDGSIFLALNTIEETLQLCIDYEYPDEGIKIANAVLETVTYNSDFWQYKGTLHNQIGEYEEALLALEKSLELNSFDTETLINHAIALEALGNLNEATKTLEKAMEIEPSNIDVLLSLALIYGKTGRSVQAVELLQKVIELDPENTEAWYELAFSYENIQMLNESLEAYTKYIDLEPESYYGWYNKGIVLIQMGDFEQAIEHFEYAVLLNDTFQSAYFNMGICHLTLGKYDDSVTDFNKAVELDDEDEFAWFYLGKSSYGKNDLANAVIYFTKAIELSSDYLEAYLARGKAYEKLGERNSALLDFNRVVLLSVAEQNERDENTEIDFNSLFEIQDNLSPDQNYKVTLQNIDKLIFTSNREDLLELLNLLEKKFPGDAQILLRKAFLYFEYGQYEMGISSFRNAITKDKNLQNKLRRDFSGLLDSGILKELIEGK
jgi:tetratricopeptide (TPR) repeat protein